MDHELLHKIRSVEFWNQLCPELHVTVDQPLAAISSWGDELQLRQDDWARCKATIHKDGYFAYESWFATSFMDRIAKCIHAIDQAGMPLALCFVYDEFWQLLMQLDPLLSDLMGDYECLPAVWAWFVKHDRQTGFPPHRDGVRDVSTEDPEHLDYLTIWIPLTDIGHLDSCINVLPASLDPLYSSGTERVLVEDQQDVRSLQGPRGSVFCWTIGLAHWGTKQSEFGVARKSVGFFVQNEDADCLIPPALDFDTPLSFVERLALIGRQILDYSRSSDESELELGRWLQQLVPEPNSQDG